MSATKNINAEKIQGSLTADTINIQTLGSGTSVTNLGIDSNGNVVTGTTGGGGDNFYVTGFTYNDANTFTISQNGGLSDLTSTINTVTGLTINGDLDVTGNTTLNTLTATSITSNSAIDVFNGHINLRDNSYFLQGRTIADANVSLIGVDNQDRVFIGNAGYDTFIDSDTIVDGSLTATTLNITTIGGTTPVTNLGIDSSGNVVSGDTSLWSTNVNGIHYDTGNVGIGMSASSVNTKLEINYTGTSEAAFRIKNTTNNSQYNFSTELTDSEHLLRLNSDNTGITPLVLSSSNKVGVGIPNTIVPEATLHIYSTSGSQPIVLVEDETNPDATPLIIDTDGNVGIGTDTPTEKLEVSGNTTISGTLNIGTIGSGTPVNNLGFDSNGQVVSGTTGGTGVSDDNKIFSWFMNVS